MLTAQDLHGVMAMMPAFATPDAADINATSTIDVDNLKAGVDRIIRDGIDVIATTGSFGEFHTLLPDEFATLARATVEAVNQRVPLFIGCTALNSREAVQKMRVAREAGAEGVLVGVPFYFPSTVENAVRFYTDISALFPDLAIMIYHNPDLHHVTLPVDCFRQLGQLPNVVAMKDSHRDPRQMLRLRQIVGGKISVFVNQLQYYPYTLLGAAGCWSIEAWQGPWPLLRLRDAIAAGDAATAQEIILALSADGDGPPNLSWRETARKISIRYAGYCDPGPLRPPFVEIPAAVDERARRRAAYWGELCAKYRPQVEGLVAAGT
ncbi:MAG TPA: dihydrodipicolinate synthase family protein [Chloroflexota bacterium]|nr:dihydrodipicolinate synthase family protein [Chloroflexota bacterium]